MEEEGSTTPSGRLYEVDSSAEEVSRDLALSQDMVAESDSQASGPSEEEEGEEEKKEKNQRQSEEEEEEEEEEDDDLRTLFTKGGRPMGFYIPPCPTKAEICDLIEKHGGMVNATWNADLIALAEPQSKRPPLPSCPIYATDYIRECVKSRTLLPIREFAFQGTSPSPRQRRQYSSEDDKKILEYVRSHVTSGGPSLTGNNFWKAMEEAEIVPGHTWMSLRDRYLKRLRDPYIESPKRPGRPTRSLSQPSSSTVLPATPDDQDRPTFRSQEERRASFSRKRLFTDTAGAEENENENEKENDNENENENEKEKDKTGEEEEEEEESGEGEAGRKEQESDQEKQQNKKNQKKKKTSKKGKKQQKAGTTKNKKKPRTEEEASGGGESLELSGDWPAQSEGVGPSSSSSSSSSSLSLLGIPSVLSSTPAPVLSEAEMQTMVGRGVREMLRCLLLESGESEEVVLHALAAFSGDYLLAARYLRGEALTRRPWTAREDAVLRGRNTRAIKELFSNHSKADVLSRIHFLQLDKYD